MEVEILTMTSEPLRAVWCAARTCYSSLAPKELWNQDPAEEQMVTLIRKIIQSQHLSVVEHFSITYAVSGVSRSLLAQYSRHRIGISLSVQSQRYVSEQSSRNGGQFEAVLPPSIQGQAEASALLSEYLERCQGTYDQLLALGVPKEDARFVLPNAAATNLVTTVNLRSLLDLYEKRVLTPGAQWEIKQMIRLMAERAIQREPWLEEFFPEPERGDKG